MTRRLSLASTVPLVFATALLLALVPAGAWSAPAGKTVDVIVVLHDAYAPGGHAANQAAAARVASEHGVSARHTYGTALFGFAASVPESRLARLRSDSRVDYVDLDGPMSIAAPSWCGDNPDHPACADDGGDDSTTPSEETIPWGVNRIGADLNSNEGLGVHVYVIDTGIDADHLDLEANLALDRERDHYAVEQCKGGDCLYPWDDDHDHGTHVAGTVGAIDNEQDVIGVASQVTLHAVKVLAKNGMGSRSGVTAGIDWMTGHVSTEGYGGKAVANMSLGGSGSKSGTCSAADGFEGTDSYHNAICNATNVGVVFAVAAGNDGADAENYVPAAYDDAVITTSATKCTATNNVCDPDTDDWTSWSNWGDDSALWTSNASTPVAIAAPGSSIVSLKRGGGTTTMSGTSMSAPHVAGAAALFLKSSSQAGAYSAFTNARSALLTNAEATTATNGWSNTTGEPHHEDFLDVSSFTSSS